jgi:hypothetical protein
LENPSFLFTIHREESSRLREAIEALLKPGLDEWLKEVVGE